ncbi:MAG TPA: glycosyltransferase 87 family protein, partial [Candidatus Methylacidiphilales bacterium]
APLYELTSIHGFLYFPQAALFFLPFTPLPLPLGEVLWRLLSLGFLAYAVAKLVRHLRRERAGRPDAPWFVLLSFLVIPASFASARNGQTNLALAAALLLAGLELIDRRWTTASLLLLLMLALKPIAAAPLLLAAAVHPPMRGRLALGLVVFVLLPFFFAPLHPGYVLDQYDLMIRKLKIAGSPDEHGFADLGGLLWTFLGRPVPQATLHLVSAGAALGVLVLSFAAQRRDPRNGPLWLVGLAGAYLMLFNPRTEENSYVLLAAAALPFVADAMATGRVKATLALLPAVLLLGCDSYGDWIRPWAHLWLKPLLALAFLGYLMGRMGEKRGLFVR